MRWDRPQPRLSCNERSLRPRCGGGTSRCAGMRESARPAPAPAAPPPPRCAAPAPARRARRAAPCRPDLAAPFLGRWKERTAPRGSHGLIDDRRPACPLIVCGVDDAGRGSMIGPLVIAGVAVRRGGLRRLRDIGVRDSKALTPARREEMYGQITEAAYRWHASKIGPSTVDRSVFRHRLNALEAAYMARVISRLGAGAAYVDSCDVDAGRFGREVSSRVRGGGRCHRALAPQGGLAVRGRRGRVHNSKGHAGPRGRKDSEEARRARCGRQRVPVGRAHGQVCRQVDRRERRGGPAVRKGELEAGQGHEDGRLVGRVVGGGAGRPSPSPSPSPQGASP